MNVNIHNIQSAEYIREDGRAALMLTIDGHQGTISDFKYTLLQEGVVPIRDVTTEFRWADVLPVITLPPKPEDGRGELHLRGFTNDPTIIQMARDFWDAVNELNGKCFQTGPVSIPR